MIAANKGTMTTGEVATHFGTQAWAVRRLYERGLLPAPPRVGAYRAIPVEDLPRIRAALVECGYIQPDEQPMADPPDDGGHRRIHRDKVLLNNGHTLEPSYDPSSVCPSCGNRPPAGFACLQCDRIGPPRESSREMAGVASC